MKAGILEMVPLKESVDDIGGLENLKDWLKKKAMVYGNIKNAVEFGVAIGFFIREIDMSSNLVSNVAGQKT